MPTIRELLARRTDLSTFVVHLTRKFKNVGAPGNLKAILTSGRIEARSPFGSAVDILNKRHCAKADYESQKCVCFTETPLEHLHLLLQEISDLKRSCVFGPYGIAVTKRVARKTGINPVWYTDMSQGGHEWLIKPVNKLVEQALKHLKAQRDAGDEERVFGNYDIAMLTPFIEQMGTGPGFRKEFWWEREWRHLGDYELPPRVIAIAPESEHDALAEADEERAVFIDASWGLEEIIGRLAGFRAKDVGTF